MTKEEAREIFLNRGYIQVKGGRIYDGDKWRESVVVISKWLEQEPSDDMVSRGVFEQVKWERDVAIEQLKELGYGLGEKPRIGHWIDGDDKCPCCGKSKFEGLDADIWADWQPKFCPQCGAKMSEISTDSEKE